MTTYSAVVTTGIYCRPGCRARPRAENVRTFELAASAEAAGFRACLRCRPYRTAAPLGADAPELVCRAVQLIIEGVLDTGTEAALGARLAVSPRHLRRIFNDRLGITPSQLAMSRRAHFARRLLDDTDMAVADVAFASGFASLRQFNRQMREVFRAAPSDLRARRRRADRLAADGGLTMRLPFQPPFDWDAMAAFFASRAVPGVESVSGGVYRRTISLDGAPGMLEIHPGGADHLLLRAHLPYWEGLIHVAGRAGRMAGTGASPDARAPGAWGPFEAAVQAVVTQECDDPGQARAQLGRIAERFGPPVPGLPHGLARLFPSAEVLAAGNLAELDLPPATAKTLTILAAGVATGQLALDHSASHADLISSLTAVAGIQPATAGQIALRLGHQVLSRQEGLTMVSESQHAKAAALRSLHEDGIFVLPNAWDAGSAAMIAAAGARVIATTSAGVSWSLGRPDGQNLSRPEATDAVRRIVDAVDVPVTADIEGGYGSDPGAVAATVAAMIGAGAVGINLEDSGAPGGGLFDTAAQAARIRAARAAAADAGLPELVINARTDVFLFEIGEPGGRLEDVLARAGAYADAGADSLFVPGLLDLATLATLTSKSSLPVNVMAGPGAPDVATLRAAGVRRVSLGQAITQAAYTLARKAAAEVLTAGTYDSIADADSFSDINGAFRARR